MANRTSGSGSSRLRSRGVLVVALTALLLVLGGGIAGGLAFATIGQSEKDEFLDDVASRLGVSRENLDQAIEDAAKARIDAAEEEGQLSPARADRLREAIESGRSPFLGGKKRGGLHGHGFRGLGGVLETLDLTPQELRERLPGSSIAAIAEEQGVTLDEIKEPILERAGARLDEKVEQERITSAQRQEMLDRIELRLDDLLNREWPESLDDFRGRFGFGRGAEESDSPAGAPADGASFSAKTGDAEPSVTILNEL